MNAKSLVRLSFLLAPLAAFLLAAHPALAQNEPAEGTGLSKTPASEAFDQKALEKLQRMSPEEVGELDRKLAEALTLYYDREYARALPIFQDIADTVETMDVAFWLASCAAKAGEHELAVRKFKEMLRVDPDLHRVRLELATVYYSQGRYAEARDELSTVLEADPPEPVRRNIEKLLASIDARTRRLYTNLRVSFGIQKDSNVSSGPDESFIVVPGGGIIGPLTETQKEARDEVAVLNMAGNALYDMGDRRGFMWNSTGTLYNTHNFEHIQFDFLHWRLTTGPWWVWQKGVFKLPFGYAQNTFEHDHLFDTWDITPSYEHFITPKFSLKGTFGYIRDTYEPADKVGQDNLKRLIELTANLYLNQRRDILSFSVADEDSNAKDPRFGYDAIHWAASYFKRFNMFDWDMEFYARYKYTLKHYTAAALLWPVGEHRKDNRHNFYTVLSRNFGKYYFTSVSFNYIDNESTVGLYDFDKFIYNLSVGFKF
jgi:tetratricopeptide (TPR) repeat protein